MANRETEFATQRSKTRTTRGGLGNGPIRLSRITGSDFTLARARHTSPCMLHRRLPKRLIIDGRIPSEYRGPPPPLPFPVLHRIVWVRPCNVLNPARRL
jgi:hypothetical protein